MCAKIFSKGVDLSEHQGTVDFNKLKASGIDFVILRAGYGSANLYPEQYDARFEEYYKKAKAAGLGVGAYWYSYAESLNMARDEAESFITALKGKQFDYPVYIDLEEDEISKRLGKAKYSDVAAKILSTVESNGYWVGIYASLYYLSNMLDMSKLSRYSVWCAQWNDVCQYENAGIWQYTNSHTVNGIAGKVDADYAYYDYPSQIKAKGLNGYKKKSNNKDLIRTKLEQIEVLANEIESLI